MHDDSIRIPLTRGAFALIDAADVDLILPHRWQLMSNGYAARSTSRHEPGGKKAILMHRAILNPPAGINVDHISGDKLDNRRANLRFASQAQNVANSRRSRLNPSGFRGVYRHDNTQKWQVKLGNQHVGYFATAEDAAHAYDRAAKERWGEFARLNFPEE